MCGEQIIVILLVLAAYLVEINKFKKVILGIYFSKNVPYFIISLMFTAICFWLIVHFNLCIIVIQFYIVFKSYILRVHSR